MKRLILSLILLVYCKQVPVPPPEPPPKKPFEVNLSISESHQKVFKLDSKEYKNFESFFVFNRMKEHTKGVCIGRHIIPGFNWVVSALMNGCLNFYMMNDLGANQSFEYVFTKAKMNKDCYTVGFSQLYLMNESAKCNSLSVIDIDWRIIYTHYQMMLYSKKEFQIFNEMDLGNLKPSIHQFCERHDMPSCKKAFASFFANYKKLDSVNLQLGFLHEFKFRNTGNDIVLYVSNAIDPEYTNQKQFDKLIENIFNAITRQDAYIIYHTGGGHEYAIYKLFKFNEAKRIVTVCRDYLVWAPSYGGLRGKPYKTYLDDGKEHIACRNFK